MNQDFLTVSQLAEKLQVPKSWVYGQTRQTAPGSIPRVQVGKHIRFVESEIMEWLRKENEAR